MTLTEEQFVEDVRLLNESAVHIVTTRDARGVPHGLDRETIHALAEVVRCFKRTRVRTPVDYERLPNG